MHIDFHIHSNTSSDTEMTAADIVMTAEERGIKAICITNHHEPMEVKKGDDKQSLTPEKTKRFNEELAAARKNAGIKVMNGVELSYTENEEEDIKKFIADNNFDFVLGTIHYARGWQVADIRNKGKIAKKEEKKVLEEYFRRLKNAIKSGLFDVMAHMDNYKRLIEEPPFNETKKEWEEVARLLLETGTGFEINTSWSKISPGGTYPSRQIIELLVERGVRIITTGSDAHRLTEIGIGIDDAEKLLIRLGVSNIYKFENRKAIAIKLNGE
jgi:histidinol-phosphatase (PHP family)